MIVGDIEIEPLAAESMGTRSMCVRLNTPDLSMVLDPSAALSTRFGLDPHPAEYRRLETSLQSIFVAARKADVISISHYHYDHVRPGFMNFRYNFSSREELQRMFEGKVVLAKDNRESINASQRRRGFYFEKDVGDIADEIRWADGKSYSFGQTTVSFSRPLPHGPSASELGYVIATRVTHRGRQILFVPDVQGPVDRESLSYCISEKPDVALIGGPPLYLDRFEESHRQAALYSLAVMAPLFPVLVVDHHLMRSLDWQTWLSPVVSAAERAGNRVMTMAEFSGVEVSCLEANRKSMYSDVPPSEEFMKWTGEGDEYKEQNKPPLA